MSIDFSVRAGYGFEIEIPENVHFFDFEEELDEIITPDSNFSIVKGGLINSGEAFITIMIEDSVIYLYQEEESKIKSYNYSLDFKLSDKAQEEIKILKEKLVFKTENIQFIVIPALY